MLLEGLPSISAAPDGSVWVSAALARRRRRSLVFERSAGSAVDTRPAQPALGRVGRTGRVTYHPLTGGEPRWPGSLTPGPDGAIWFLDGPAPAGPTMGHLAAGSRALWFSQPNTRTLGLITCQGGR